MCFVLVVPWVVLPNASSGLLRLGCEHGSASDPMRLSFVVSKGLCSVWCVVLCSASMFSEAVCLSFLRNSQNLTLAFVVRNIDSILLILFDCADEESSCSRKFAFAR